MSSIENGGKQHKNVKTSDYSYNAQDNLEKMQEAVNYNRYQINFITREASKFGNKQLKILDFGAGIGTYADMLKKQGYSVDCVEIDPREKDILNGNGYKVYEGIGQVQSNYDIIYSLNVLEHIENDAEALEKLKSCLSKDGVIIIFVPAFQLIFTQLDVIADHFRRYSKKDITSLAAKTNLTVKVKYCDPLGFISALIYRIVGGSGKLNAGSIQIFDKVIFPISMFIEPLTKSLFGKNILAIFTNPINDKLNDTSSSKLDNDLSI